MKAFALTLALFGITVLGITDEVPKIVKKAFEKKYDKVNELSWSQEGHLFQASFKHEGAYKVANFEKDGTWTKTATYLEIDKLDSCMTDFIKEDYPNSEIVEGNLVEVPGTAQFEVLVRTSEEIEVEEGEKEEIVYEFTKLIFSEDCEFIGEEEYEGIW